MKIDNAIAQRPSERTSRPRRSSSRETMDGTRADAGQTALLVAGAAFFIMVLLGPLMTFAEGTGASAQQSGSGSTLRQIGYLLILALSIYGAVRQRGMAALMLPWPLLLALAWCWISLAWAINVGIAVRSLVLTTLTAWNTFILVQAAGYERTLSVLRVVLCGLLAVNFAVVVLDPGLGKHLMLDSAVATTNVGAWRGIMGHKNVAGAACAITVLLFLFDAGQIKLWLRALVVATAGTFLFMSQSKTSAGMLGIAILCGWIYHRFSERIRKFLIPIIMFTTAVIFFLGSTYSSFVVDNYLNAKAFTGRGWIWSAMLRYSGDHLLLGSGFGSFWNIGGDSPIYKYGLGFVREVTVGHNGFLDLLVSVGLVGLLLVVFATILRPTWQLLTNRVIPARGALAVTLLVFCVGHNVTETSVLARDVFVGVIMLIAIAFANNRDLLGLPAGKKVGGGDVFAALAKRGRETARA